MKRRLVLSLLACGAAAPVMAEASHLVSVVQKGRAFSTPAIVVDAGDTVRFTNEDSFLHQLFVQSSTFNVETGEQRPGQDVDIRFSVPGRFQVLCAIHPKMALSVEVR